MRSVRARCQEETHAAPPPGMMSSEAKLIIQTQALPNPAGRPQFGRPTGAEPVWPSMERLLILQEFYLLISIVIQRVKAHRYRSFALLVTPR